MLPSCPGGQSCSGHLVVPKDSFCPCPLFRGKAWHCLAHLAHCPLPTDAAETQAATMPDSPADVKTQPRATPPSMPPPPPTVTQGATRHPSFTPSTSEYQPASVDGEEVPGREAARLPLPPDHRLCPGSRASSAPCVLLAVPWVPLLVLASQKVFGCQAPSHGSCTCPWGAPQHCPLPAVLCEVLRIIEP